MAKTAQLAVLADINEKFKVLDVTSGKGGSAIFLAKRFGAHEFMYAYLQCEPGPVPFLRTQA